MATERTGPRRPRLGIRARVVVWYLVLFATLLGVGVFTLHRLLVARMDTDINALLSQEAQELRLLVGGVDPETGEPFGDDPRPLFESFLRSNVTGTGEAFFAVVDGEPYASSAAPPYDLLGDADLVGRWGALTTGSYGQLDTPAGPVRWLAVPVGADDGPAGVFVVTQFYADELDSIRSTTTVLAWLAGGLLLLATALGWLAAGRALAPIGRLERAARRAGAEDLSERLPVSGQDEVARLTRTFNDLLERLEAAFTSQRAFLDDVGHDLRTPLTILRGNLELLPDDPGERAAVVEVCLDELSRMERYVADLIVLARAGQPDFVRAEPVDVATLTDRMLSRARGLAEDRDWVLDARAEVTVVMDAARVTQAWVNLVDNATQHTRPGGSIGLGSAVSGDVLSLWVDDDGPGVAVADRLRVFERHARLGAAHESRPEGSGLGLAIVQAVAEAHGGRASVVDGTRGGARFVLEIPASAADPEPVLELTRSSEEVSAS